MRSFSQFISQRSVLIFSVIAALTSVSAMAQTAYDTLAPVKVHGKRKTTGDAKLETFSEGQKVIAIDSALLAQYARQSIATLLERQLPVFVKSYSFNGLATVSFRGASAAQSQVLWNGVPIQNAALGVADIGAIAPDICGRLNVVYGGSAALYGSGNTGGALLLESPAPVFDTTHKQLKLSAGAGSFGQYSGSANGSISGKQWYLSGNVVMQRAQNNYSFTDYNGVEHKMPNSQLNGAAVLVNAACKLTDKDVIELHAWEQRYLREIPPALFEPVSLKQQEDEAFRTVAQWRRAQDRHNVYVRSSFIADRIKYSDGVAQVSSNNHVYQYYQEAGWEQQLKNSDLLIFLPATLAWTLSPYSREDSLGQYRVAIAGAYTHKLFRQRLNISVQARGEYVNNNSILLPGCGAVYRVSDWLLLQGNIQRTYRLPTLNELYYFPGGNMSLKPEEGWTEDAGYKIKLAKGRVTIDHEASAFNRNIRNWILWFGGAIWTPHNIAEVHSRGTETDNKLTLNFGKWKLHSSIATAYYLSTTTRSALINDGSVGKQIPYAPRYNARANVGFSFGKLWVNYNHTYTGYRFITTDESAWLEPYQTGNIQASYRLAASGRQLTISGQCNNVWNSRYFVSANRPMPGINCLAGLSLSL